MMMTEDEAKETRCCGSEGCGWLKIHPNSLEPIGRFCIGSACMAWRWDMDWASSTAEGNGGDVVVRLKRLNGEPKRGYCGLAGNGAWRRN